MNKFPKWVIGVFVLLIIIFLTGGFWFYFNKTTELRSKVEDELNAIAELKADQITRWIAERTADADVLQDSPYLKRGIIEWRKYRRSQDLYSILERFKSLKTYYNYSNGMLVSNEGNIEFGIDDYKGKLHQQVLDSMQTAIRMKKPIITDLHEGPAGLPPHLDIIVPIIDDRQNLCIASIILQCDANQFLYPLIQSWPTPSKTAETLLGRREGNDVVFLNSLRHSSAAPFTLRLPLNQKDLPLAMAAKGMEGVVEGNDYRGVAVLAVVKKVKSTPWLIVSKLDRSEAFDSLQRESLMILGLLFCGVTLLLIWMFVFWQQSLKALSQNSEENLRKTQHFSHVGSWEWNIKSGKVIWSEEMYHLFGLEKKGINEIDLNSIIAKAIHPDDQAAVQRGNLMVIENKKPEPLEYRVVWPDGNIHVIYSKAGELDLDAFGNASYLRGYAQDITERKQAEKNLKQIEWLLTRETDPRSDDSLLPFYGDLTMLNKSRVILDSIGHNMLSEVAGDYVNLLETSGAIYEANGDYALGIFSSGYCKFLDSASYKLCGTDDNRIALSSGKWLCHESCWNDSAKASIEKGEAVDIECNGGIHLYATPIRAGSRIVGSMNFGYGTPPQDPEKLREIAEKYRVNIDQLREYADAYETRPPFFLEMAKNRLKTSALLVGEIIERKQVQEKIRTLNDNLEQRVVERTAELQSAKDEIEALSYSVSHDLRAPIRAIDGFTKMLANGYRAALDDEGKRLLDVVLKNTRNMGQLIDDLLAFSRMSRKKVESELVQMETLVKELAKELKDSNKDRKLQIKINQLSNIKGDRALLRQVIVNLLSNAIKFTKTRERAVIEIGNMKKNKQNTYYIKDNGVGFDMKYISKIFDVFQRLHSAKDFEGTGVGLAIVHKIIQRHGGKIWAESKVNEGATFYFTIFQKGDTK